jgi:hypothetical protein
MFPSIPTYFSDDAFYQNVNASKRTKTQKYVNYERISVLCTVVVNIRQENKKSRTHFQNKKYRSPTPFEISKGVLSHLLVEEAPREHSKHVDKYYWTRNGKKYRSIPEIKRDTVFLNVYKNQKFYSRVGRLLSETSAEIIKDLSPGATLFYQGVGRPSEQMLRDFLCDSEDVRLLQGKEGKENIFTLKLK